jgi:hypothetical protein
MAKLKLAFLWGLALSVTSQGRSAPAFSFDWDICLNRTALHELHPTPAGLQSIDIDTQLMQQWETVYRLTANHLDNVRTFQALEDQLSHGFNILDLFHSNIQILTQTNREPQVQNASKEALSAIAQEAHQAARNLNHHFGEIAQGISGIEGYCLLFAPPRYDLWRALDEQFQSLNSLGKELTETEWPCKQQCNLIRQHLRFSEILVVSLKTLESDLDQDAKNLIFDVIDAMLQHILDLIAIDPALAKWWEAYLMCLLEELMALNMISRESMPPPFHVTHSAVQT